jgi:acyl-CoA dehydrogenase
VRFETESELDEFRSVVREFVDEQIAPRLFEHESKGTFPHDVLALIRDAGYTGIRLPPEYGGKGLSFQQYCVVVEEFARTGPALYLWINDSVGLTLVRRGSEEQKAKYLPRYAAGELTAAMAFSESEAGSDAAAIRTRAERRAGMWVINGRKHYISKGDSADFFIVTAVTDKEKGARGGITAFIIDRQTPGLTVSRVETTMGAKIYKLAELTFEDCAVADNAVLGEVGAGFTAAMSTLEDGRVSVAATCLGIAGKLLELMIEHAKTRKTFGAPLADRQGIRWMIADSAMELELGRALVRQTIDKMERGERIGAAASMCKLHCSEMLGRIADRAVQIHGGMGIVEGLPIERFYREVRFFRVGEGASEIQRMLIARSLLGRPSREGD